VVVVRHPCIEKVADVGYSKQVLFLRPNTTY
jgi:hypothetical protein